MLISEIKGWQWAITFDNPQPADSSTMVTALRQLGKLTKVETKTTWILAPSVGVKPTDIRQAIVSNLHPAKGNAIYVNLRSGKGFEYGPNTGFRWRRVI